MEIGPIAGIPLVPTVKPLSAVPDPSGVFAVTFRKQAGKETADDEYAAGGLEDDESEDASASAEDETTPDEIASSEPDPEAGPQSTVSFFA
jgi:hypothetical protein